ncbi:MAG TPA: hypothetical protein VGM90_14065 [Kofleriaceae bacterium]
MTLRFNFKEYGDEIGALAVLAEPHLDATAVAVLNAYSTDLRTIRDSRHFEDQTWEIPTSAPLKTTVSEGKYEPNNRRGSHHVQAHISTTWQIKPVRRPGAKSVAVQEFDLSGKASTRVEFHDVTTGNLIGLWKMEVGNPGAPGCHFHVGIGGEEDWPYFPSTLSVPRLPSFLFSAMSVTEFVLNELFQDDWPKTAAKPHGRGAEQWNPIQRKRLLSLLQWKYETVSAASKSSPWCDLKSEKPRRDLFVEDSTQLVRA